MTLAPGGFTGWHTHPGPAVGIVKSGSFTLYEADDASCAGTTSVAGQVVVDEGYGNVHFGRSEGASAAELWITFLAVPPGTSPRIDAPNPGNCGF